MHLKVLKVLFKYHSVHTTRDALDGYFKFKYGLALDPILSDLLSIGLICKSGPFGDVYILHAKGKKYLAYRRAVNHANFSKAFFTGLGVLASICTVAGFLLPLFT